MRADDITNFPPQKVVPLPESIPYPEGKYRPASVPLHAGFYPYNMYLQRGKVRFIIWKYRCTPGVPVVYPRLVLGAMGYVTQQPLGIDQSYLTSMSLGTTRCVLVSIVLMLHSVMELIGYYYHIIIIRLLVRYMHSTHRGFAEIWGYISFMATSAFVVWNFYQ